MKKIVKTLIYRVSLFAFLGGTLLSCNNQNVETEDKPLFQIISNGGDAAEYQAFTDATRLSNGDIAVVFYAGDGHVTYTSDSYPKAGRICLVRSSDEGKTWTLPETIFDDDFDNRDPHISQMDDGTVVVTFFSLSFQEEVERKSSGETPIHYKAKHRKRKNEGLYIVRSFDNGDTWEEKPTRVPSGTYGHASSAPVRQMPDGDWLYPAYHQGGEAAWGSIFRSQDNGNTWAEPVFIDPESNIYLPAETDIVLLDDGTLYAALRGSIENQVNMHYATSDDLGRSWSAVSDIGFQGHAPHLLKLKSGAIVMTYRAFRKDFEYDSGYTGFRISYDEGKSWQGPYLIDEYWGAYASTVELNDGTLLIVFYEEGENSRIRAIRAIAPEKNSEVIPKDSPEYLNRMPFG